MIWAVLPTYNEAENIERMVGALLGVFDRAALPGHILVVDDNSPDGTGALADALAERNDHVTVLHRPEKEGLGRAYVAGFEAALAMGADLVIEMDCDFSHDSSRPSQARGRAVLQPTGAETAGHESVDAGPAR